MSMRSRRKRHLLAFNPDRWDPQDHNERVAVLKSLRRASRAMTRAARQMSRAFHQFGRSGR